VSQAEKNGPLIWVSGGKKFVFLIKTVLNGGIRAISLKKKCVTPQTVLIETGDSLYPQLFHFGLKN
jgi:hypothetical protein